MIRFNVKGITVLQLGRGENEDYGVCIPANCHVRFRTTQVPVTFNYDNARPVGYAVLKRRGNKIVADLELHSDMYPPEEVHALLRALFPAIGFQALAYTGQELTDMEIYTVALTSVPNTDPSVPALGDRVTFLDKGELH